MIEGAVVRRTHHMQWAEQLAVAPVVTHHFVKVADGSHVHWRAAGPLDAPILILLHGYPSSSYQYRNLMPLLARDFRTLAPDYPNFGLSVAPAGYTFTFEALAHSVMLWLDALRIETFVAYIFDFGAPVAFNILSERPDAVRAVISQNGNIYDEGLGNAWDARRKWWSTGDRHDAHYVKLTREALSVPPRSQYETGTPQERLGRLDPMLWMSDFKFNMQGKEEALMDLFFDYAENVRRYPTWQDQLRKRNIPLLAVWGKHDALFVPAGAEAFTRDLPGARVVLLDGGHFLLETHLAEVYREIAEFLKTCTGL